MTNQPLDPIRMFESEREQRMDSYASDRRWRDLSNQWMQHAFEQKYVYNFSWMGRPVIQMPGDLIALQELIWQVRPQLIIETGIAHGGSLIFHASMLELLGEGEVLGIDIDIRPHNLAAIEGHPMAKRIRMLQGSSTDPAVIAEAVVSAKDKRTLVVLDSNHTHEHVLAELMAYAPLVSVGSYCVVFDTVVEDLRPDTFPDRPWSPGDSPKTAVAAFLRDDDRFQIDRAIADKIQISAAPDGYLRRVR
jgi:cephalosporin hydroxylase